MPIVDHRAPIHDELCRCTSCKPSLLSNQAAFRIEVSLIVLLVTIGAMMTTRL